MDYNATVNILSQTGILMGEVTAIVMALMQIVKQFSIPKRFLPIVAIVISVAATSLFIGWTKATIIVGLVTGLTSMGLYTGGKTLIKK